MLPIIVERSGVLKLINSLVINSSPGYDSINTKFLKSTNVVSSLILTKLFQQSLDKSTLPKEWTVGKVVPLHKSGNKHSPNNRPISFTNTCCKLLEHIIFFNLANFLEYNSFFTPAQHGFCKTFSCETQLVSFSHELHQIVDRFFANCIFFSISLKHVTRFATDFSCTN